MMDEMEDNEEAPIDGQQALEGAIPTVPLQFTINFTPEQVARAAMPMIMDCIRREVVGDIKKKAQQQAFEQLQEWVAETAKPAFQELFTRQFARKDEFGSSTGESISIQAKMVQMFESYLKEHVDSQGRRESYSTSNSKPRAAWLIQEWCNEVVKKDIKEVFNKIEVDAKKALQDTIAALLASKFGK